MSETFEGVTPPEESKKINVVDLIRKQTEGEIAEQEDQREQAKNAFNETLQKTREQLDSGKNAIDEEIKKAINKGQKKIRIGATGSYTVNFKGLDIVDTSEAALQATQKWISDNYGDSIRVSTEQQNYPGSGNWPSGSADYLVLSW